MINYRGKLIYNNPLSNESDIAGFRMEGSAKVYFENGNMRMRNMLDESLGQKSNFVFWCPENFPSDIVIEWDFRPIEEPGLAILFFSAQGTKGQDLFDETLAPRDGQYDQYHSGDINAFHVSYFRRKWDTERCFHTSNLRKSKGFHLVAQGADPIPDVSDCKESYHISVVKYKNIVKFFVDELLIFTFEDDGTTYGSLLSGGKIGFRQMAPMIGEYSNLMVYEAKKE